MTEESKLPSQSINFNGTELSNVQIGGQSGRDIKLSQSQDIHQETKIESLGSAEVTELIGQLVQLLKNSNITTSEKEKIERILEVAKDEVNDSQPDKEFVAKSLQKASKTIKSASETIDAGSDLWQKSKLILEKIRPWLKITTSFLL